jgi:hypothetical protein
MDIAMVRQRATDASNRLAIEQVNPATKFAQWIQINAGDNKFFSLKARTTKPWQTTSEQLVQTFVIAKLLSQRATVEVLPSTALDATCNGCDLFNVLLSSSGMFWNSVRDVCVGATGPCENKVAINLHLPAHFLSQDDGGKCGMAFCKVSKAVCDAGASTCITKYSEFRLVDVCMFDKGLPRPKFDSSGKCHKQTAAGTNGATIVSKTKAGAAGPRSQPTAARTPTKETAPKPAEPGSKASRPNRLTRRNVKLQVAPGHPRLRATPC